MKITILCFLQCGELRYKLLKKSLLEWNEHKENISQDGISDFLLLSSNIVTNSNKICLLRINNVGIGRGSNAICP